MLLGLDLGTTNVKALLADDAGTVLARGSAPCPTETEPGGVVKQDIDQITRAAFDAIAQVTAGRAGRDVRAVGVSSQAAALQLLDERYNPLGPVVGWQDGRGEVFHRQSIRRLGRDWFVRHTGRGKPACAFGQLLRLHAEQPHLLQPPNRVGFVGDVVVHRLTGRGAHDPTSLSICTMYSPRTRRTTPELLGELGLSAGQLPDLLPADRPAGTLLPDVARQLHLPVGIPVSPAVHDQYAAALACGAVRPGDVMFGAGTAWVLLAVDDRLREPVIDEAFTCPHVVPDRFGQLLSMVNGGSAVAWALRLTGLDKTSDLRLDDLLQRVDPGADGLVFRPLLLAGGGAKLAPGTKGQLDGLRIEHTPAHLLRAVVEGLACELDRYLELLRQGGTGLQRLLCCGPAAASPVTSQLLADVTGLSVACSTEPEMSACGSLLLAAVLADPDTALAELAPRRTHPAEVRLPGPHRDVYRELTLRYRNSLQPFGS